MANNEVEMKLQDEDSTETADPLTIMARSVHKASDQMDNLNAPSQPQDSQAKNDNGKQTQCQNNQSANTDVSTKSETHTNEQPLGELDQRGQQSSTNLNIPMVKKEHHSLYFKKEVVDEGAEHICRFTDREVQCREDQINEGQKIPKAPVKLRFDALHHFVAVIALAVALYTQFISIPSLKQGTSLTIDSCNVSQVQEWLKDFSKRLASLESSMQDITARIEGFEKNLEKLNAVAYKDDITNLVQKTDFEDRIRKSEHNFLEQVSVKVEEVKSLKEQFRKLEDEVGMKFEGISHIKNEQKELKTNMMTLEDKLGKQSQHVEEKNAEVVKEMSQHKEAVHGLNVSLKNLGSNMKYLTENITGISIETLVLEKRTEDIKENILDKGSLTIVIMINTVLLVMVIIYLVAKRDNNRYFNLNVDIEEQEVNGGVNNNPAAYSTAGRILSQVRAHPRLERKLCVISFYEETHPLHMRITQSVTQHLNIQSVEFMIPRHEDILNIPPVSLYFLFVDFNERNVILEDPTLGLGDLRLTTVQAVQKMGGRIVIFYVRDQNSKQLGSMKLYNGDLASVTRQRELSDLNRRSCFISAYDQLTDFQKTHLKRIVEDELNRR
ncbi:hypothetical protein CHS0354_004307 [Potamilus streckersoni]|uniref:Uncharacterized protein n=1 Tax=Potamilus streckersoni TaxID=2493646 RepID=A0AAE0S540_9BIVA|nr:hypothetical protein CHS0354_004307 [Potamilus streckersoni]